MKSNPPISRSAAWRGVLSLVAALVFLTVTLTALSGRADELPVLFYDDFDDGDVSDWTLCDPINYHMVAPHIEASDQGPGYVLRGDFVRGRGSQIWMPWAVDNVADLVIEMRAHCPQGYNVCMLGLTGDTEHIKTPRRTYWATIHGEFSRADLWWNDGQGGDFNYYLGEEINQWHDYKWHRRPDGTWGFYVDNVLRAEFTTGTHLTQFNALHLHQHDGDRVDWIKISGEAATRANAGLVGHWPFDEGTGTVAHDVSGNGNDGTVDGAAWTTGADNGALRFDGVDDQVIVPHSDAFNLTGANELTLCAWIRAEEFLPHSAIWNKGEPTANYDLFFWDTSGRFNQHINAFSSTPE